MREVKGDVEHHACECDGKRIEERYPLVFVRKNYHSNHKGEKFESVEEVEDFPRFVGTEMLLGDMVLVRSLEIPCFQAEDGVEVMISVDKVTADDDPEAIET